MYIENIDAFMWISKQNIFYSTYYVLINEVNVLFHIPCGRLAWRNRKRIQDMVQNIFLMRIWHKTVTVWLITNLTSFNSSKLLI